jgi:glucose-6-phosphate 1-epimerase
VADGAREEEGAAPIALTAETDRVYVPTAATCTIVDPGWKRRVTIAKSGSQATVLWNPWQEKSAAMADIGPDAWQGMVCVETANAGGQTITLEPGASHATTAVLSIEKE